MRPLFHALGASVGFLFLAACSHGVTGFQDSQDVQDGQYESEPDPSSPSSPFITTDRDSYQAESGEIVVANDTIWYLEFTIQMTYTNRSDQPVYMAWCHGPHVPRVERLMDGRWETVHRPGQLLCGNVGFLIKAGEVYDYEFRVRGYDPESSVKPAWLSDTVAGTYRVHWWNTLFTEPGRQADQVPLGQRVSSTFELNGTIP